MPFGGYFLERVCVPAFLTWLCGATRATSYSTCAGTEPFNRSHAILLEWNRLNLTRLGMSSVSPLSQATHTQQATSTKVETDVSATRALLQQWWENWSKLAAPAPAPMPVATPPAILAPTSGAVLVHEAPPSGAILVPSAPPSGAVVQVAPLLPAAVLPVAGTQPGGASGPALIPCHVGDAVAGRCCRWRGRMGAAKTCGAWRGEGSGMTTQRARCMCQAQIQSNMTLCCVYVTYDVLPDVLLGSRAK